AINLGRAIGTYLKSNHGPSVIVGRDNRLSSEALSRALIDGLRTAGCSITDIGLSSSPLLYQVVTTKGADGGVIVTASHNPKEYNGFKMVGANAQPIADEEILSIYELTNTPPTISQRGDVHTFDPTPQYFSNIKTAIRINRPL